MAATPNDVAAWGRLVSGIGADPRFLTRTAFAATKCAPGLTLAGVAGLAAPGDGGQGGVYQRVVGQPALESGWFRSRDRYLPDGTTSDVLGGYWRYAPVGDRVFANHLGGIGDGNVAAAATNRTAFATAYALCTSLGGGRIAVPKGDFVIGGGPIDPLTGYPAASTGVYLTTGVSVEGVGRGISYLTAAPGSNIHLINLSGQEKISVTGLTLRHNGSTQTLGVHAIRIGDFGGKHLIFRDLEILEAHHYGIGLQGNEAGDGVNSHIDIDNVYIFRPGADGIDIKDRAGANLALTFSKVTVEEPGYLQVVGGGDNSAGIDCRGIVMVSDCNVLGLKAQPGNDITGFRVRPQSWADPSHLGGKRSQLVNCYASGLTSAGRTVGFNILDEDVGLTNCYAEKVWRSHNYVGRNIKATNIGGKDFTEIGLALDPNCVNPRIVNATMDSAAPGATVGYYVGGATGVRLISIGSDGTDKGLRVDAGSTGRAVGFDLTNNTTASLQDLSTPGSFKFGWDAESAAREDVGTVAADTSISLDNRGAWVTVTAGPQISEIRLAKGHWRIVEFATTVRVVGSAAVASPVILPGGGASVIVSPGDTMLVRGYDNGGVKSVKCMALWRVAAGKVVSTAVDAPGVALTTAAAANVGSIILNEPGTYEISGEISFVGASSVSITALAGCLSDTVAIPNGSTIARPLVQPLLPSAATPGTEPCTYAIPKGIVEVGTSPVTVRLVARADFTVGTLRAYGFAMARMIR